VFYGEYAHAIDNKGRVIVPSRFRDALLEHGEKCYATRGLDRCLFLFPEAEWRVQEQKFRELPFTKTDSRKFNRLYFAGAAEVMCDNQGRILLPSYLKDFAGIKRDVIIIGVSNRIEIWAKEQWEQYYREAKESFEQISEKLLDEPHP